MKTKIIILILLLTAIQINAEIRFVSKTGSSATPYTSWQTAADRIQKAIDISKRGDTIYVGNGTYVDTVRMTPGIALIGSGMDSCIINSQPLSRPSDFYTVTVNDSCVLSGFYIVVSSDGTGNGIGMIGIGTNSIVKYNKVTSATCCVNIDDSSPMVRHNFLYPKRYGHGIRISGSGYNYFPQIDSNLISVNGGYGVFIVFGSKPSAMGNTFFVTGLAGRAFSGGGSDTARFCNNLIICSNCDNPISNINVPTFTLNNVIIGQTSFAGIYGNSKNVIENNHISDGKGYGLYIVNGNPVVKYNNS